MNTLISILVFLLILGLVWYVATLIPLPSPLGLIVQALIAIIAIVWLLGLLTGHQFLVLG